MTRENIAIRVLIGTMALGLLIMFLALVIGPIADVSLYDGFGLAMMITGASLLATPMAGLAFTLPLMLVYAKCRKLPASESSASPSKSSYKLAPQEEEGVAAGLSSEDKPTSTPLSQAALLSNIGSFPLPGDVDIESGAPVVSEGAGASHYIARHL